MKVFWMLDKKYTVYQYTAYEQYDFFRRQQKIKN